MKSKKQKVLILFIALSCFAPFLYSESADTAAKTRQLIPLRHYFNCYNCEIDWRALSDPNNDPIFNACITGAELSQLERLEVNDLQVRLQELEAKNILKKDASTYRLAFPTVVGERRMQLQRQVRRIVQSVLPSTKIMVQQIRTDLQQRREMLYHVTFSIVMDGPFAWQALHNELQARAGTDISLDDTAWLILPPHPYRAGTNTQSGGELAFSVTWTPSTPSPHYVLYELKKCESSLGRALARNEAIADPNAKEVLGRYGLVDEKGVLRAHVLNPTMPQTRSFAVAGATFAAQVFAKLDLPGLAAMLEVTEKEALVIAYHEVCYELLEELARQGSFEIPEIARRVPAAATQMRSLITIADISDPNAVRELFQSTSSK